MGTAQNRAGRLQALPPTFRYAEARRLSISDRALRGLRADGLIDHVGRGLYRRTDAPDAEEDLLEIATKQPEATICLGEALARHGLSDENPVALDIAIPRDSWRPLTRAPVRWHSFARDTFSVGRDELRLDESTRIGIYTAERSIIDAFRLRHREGNEQAYEALRRWLRGGGKAAAILRISRRFPMAEPALRQALEILL